MEKEIPIEVPVDNTEWDLPADDSIGDAERPHRNDEGQFDEVTS